MGLGKKPDFLEVGWLLQQIGGRAKFGEFTMRGLQDSWDPLASRGTEPVIGAAEFMDAVKERVSVLPKDASLTGLRTLQKDVLVKKVERCVAKQKCNEKMKKKMLMYGLRCYTGLSLREVGERVGGIAPIAVSQAVRRFKIATGNEKTPVALLLRALNKECQM